MLRRDDDLAAWVLEQVMKGAARPPSATLDERYQAAAGELEQPAPRRPRARKAEALTAEVRVPRHLWCRAHDRLTRSHVPFSTLGTDDPRTVAVRTTADGADLLAGFARVGP